MVPPHFHMTVLHAKLGGKVGMNDLAKCVFALFEGRTQALVALAELLERHLQRFELQPAPNAPEGRDVIGGGFPLQLLRQPKLPLNAGNRQQPLGHH